MTTPKRGTVKYDPPVPLLSIDLPIHQSVFVLSIHLVVLSSIHPSIHPSTSLFICKTKHASIQLAIGYLSIYLPICLSTYLPIYLPTYLPTYRPINLSTYRPIYLSAYSPIHFFYLYIYLFIYLFI